MDAFLLVSYGAPERKDDVVPFLENLFAGKNVSRKRITAAAEKYDEFARQTGRFSPLNDECRSLIAGIRQDFVGTPAAPPIYWGNLFWHPRLDDTLAEMADDGVTRAVCFITSAFGSHASRQRYIEAVEAVRSNIAPGILEIVWLPLPFDHPLFLEAQADRLLEALAWAALDKFAQSNENDIYVLFTAHSIPKSDTGVSEYVDQLTECARKIIELCGLLSWELIWQSRSAGCPDDWLGPDIKDRIREIDAEGRYRTVVVSPLGFFCENMETANDLDLELGKLCDELDLGFFRARAVGASPKICRMIREMTCAALSQPPTPNPRPTHP